MIAMIGMPRSGTTWVAKAIDSHPDTYYLHEPDSVNRMELPQLIGTNDADKYLGYVKQYLENIESIDNAKVVGRLPFYNKNYFNFLQLYFNRFSVTANKVAGRFSSRFAKQSPWLIKPKRKHITFWKSIESMGRVEVLAKAKPDMKILMLVRHPCAVINSEMKGEASNKFASSTPIYENWGLFQKLLEQGAAERYNLALKDIKAMHPVERLAWRWLIYHEQLLTQAQNKNCILMYYENLCSNPTETFNRLFQFLGLSFDPQVKSYLNDSTSSHSDGYYATSKDPVKAMNNWKTSLFQQDIGLIKNVVKQHLNNEYWSE